MPIIAECNKFELPPADKDLDTANTPLGVAMTQKNILVADDDMSICSVISSILAGNEYKVKVVSNGHEAKELLADREYDLLVSDIVMPGLSGMELLDEAKRFNPEMPVILLTGQASLDLAIDAVNKGADHFIRKPFKNDELRMAINKILEFQAIKKENSYLRRELTGNYDFSNIIGKSKAIQNVFKMIEKVAPTDSTVLIQGESGTGKELVAKAIHYNSSRSDRPFVEINCGALPENLLESELFGHIKGAFTGAIRDKEGLFITAKAGTIFLDEIGETSPAIQVKLLRALQEKEIIPVGGTKPIQVLARVVAATNCDLRSLMKTGSFRSDLFYRLNVFPISIPPLRERKDDIPLLSDYFLEKSCSKQKCNTKTLAPEVKQILKAYSWPGNVRELENIIERAVILEDFDTVTLEDISEEILKEKNQGSILERNTDYPTLHTLEKRYILDVLTNNNWKRNAASEVLGIDTSTLYRKIRKYKLNRSNEASME